MEKKSKLHIGWLVTAMVVVLLIIDQWIKLYIKTHFCLGESFLLQTGSLSISLRTTEWRGACLLISKFLAEPRALCSHRRSHTSISIASSSGVRIVCSISSW